jgi:hypothetical protein
VASSGLEVVGLIGSTSVVFNTSAAIVGDGCDPQRLCRQASSKKGTARFLNPCKTSPASRRRLALALLGGAGAFCQLVFQCVPAKLVSFVAVFGITAKIL